MSATAAVQKHYGLFTQRDVILQALTAAGKNPERLDAADLSPFDQLHTGGAEATTALAALLAPAPSHHVLDIGCGVGGPARLIAHAAGCRVTGIDLTPHFVATATDFSRRTGQCERTRFVTGSATLLPFADGAFDGAWHIHMSMNVADKAAMYAEIFRALRPGGRFALYDPIRGESDGVLYPVPWAATGDTSFLLRRDEMLAGIAASGFKIVSAKDATADALAWYDAAVRARAQGTAPQLHQEPRFIEMSKNHRRNLQVGAVAILRALFERPL